MVHCDSCGRAVLPSEIENGHAFELATGVLCHECFDALPADRRSVLDKRRRTPLPGTDGRSPFAAVQHQSTTRRTNPMIPAIQPRKTAVVFLGVGIGGGVLVGTLLVALLLSRSDAPSDVNLPTVVPTPPALTPPLVVAAQPPATAAPPVDEASALSARAAARLAEIKEKITPGLEKYDDVVRALKYFAFDFEGAPETGAANDLLDQVQRDYARLADAALAEAQSSAARLVYEGHREVAVSMLRGVKARFSGSEWYASGGALRVDEALSSLNAAPVINTDIAPREEGPSHGAVTTRESAPADNPETLVVEEPPSTPQDMHGVWAEIENGTGHTKTRDCSTASGGKQVCWFEEPGTAVYVTVFIARPMIDARVYLRYARAHEQDGALDVFVGPPGAGWQNDPGMRELGTMPLKSTNSWETGGWATIPAGDIAPGLWRILFVLNTEAAAGNLDIAGLVPGDVHGTWRPPAQAADGKLFDEGYLNALATTAGDRTSLLAACAAGTHAAGYRLDLVTLWTLTDAHAGIQNLRSRSLASFGGPASATRAFDAALRAKLSPRGGYRWERALAITTIDAAGDAVPKAFARYLT
jgi:hypothetical protein